MELLPTYCDFSALHISSLVTGMKWKRFTVYSVFGWVGPVLIITSFFSLDTNFRPSYHLRNCWFSEASPTLHRHDPERCVLHLERLPCLLGQVADGKQVDRKDTFMPVRQIICRHGTNLDQWPSRQSSEYRR
jgi:hypothetical protein